MAQSLTVRCIVSAPNRDVRVGKGEYAARVFPYMTTRSARRKLLQAILNDAPLQRALLRAGWSNTAHFITLPQMRILRRFGL